jgi:hypothetical protein
MVVFKHRHQHYVEGYINLKISRYLLYERETLYFKASETTVSIDPPSTRRYGHRVRTEVEPSYPLFCNFAIVLDPDNSVPGGAFPLVQIAGEGALCVFDVRHDILKIGYSTSVSTPNLNRKLN